MNTRFFKQATYIAASYILPNISYAVGAPSWVGVDNDKLRNGDITFGDIPNMILSITNFLLGFAGSVTLIMILYGAVRMGYGAVADDKEAGKKIITAGIIGFVISVSGWFLINLVISNL